jgi:hypothetical protein
MVQMNPTPPRLRTTRVPVGRLSRFHGGVGWMLLLVVAGAGCAGPSVDAPRVSPAATTSRGAMPAVPATAGIPTDASELDVPVSAWATRALDGTSEAQVMEAVRGRERGYFLEVLERVAKEPRDVSGVVRSAARALSEQGGTAGAVVVVRELWARECCMRRGFLAAGLLGLVEGLEARYAEPVEDVGTATMLDALAAHVDSEVAAAARMAVPYFMRE